MLIQISPDNSVSKYKNMAYIYPIYVPGTKKITGIDWVPHVKLNFCHVVAKEKYGLFSQKFFEIARSIQIR
jgi:hypothetical protein